MSGIYILGMEMPTNCGACPFHKLWSLDDLLQCLVNLELWCDSPERHKLCPLIPVPEHGELIEREPILDVMRKERDRISETYGPNDEYVNCLNKYAISMVTSAKTIIPADKEGRNDKNNVR